MPQAASHSLLSADRASGQSSEGSSQLMPQKKHWQNKQAPFIRDICFLGMLNEKMLIVSAVVGHSPKSPREPYVSTSTEILKDQPQHFVLLRV